MAKKIPEELEELLQPEKYIFSPVYGSLFQDATVLNGFPWVEEIRTELPKRFGTEDLYPWLEGLPEPALHIFDGLAKPHLHRIAKRYAFAASAYLKNHAHGKPLRPDAHIITRNIARPMVYVCKKLGIPPILSYSHYCQGNWVMKDKTRFFDIENLGLEQGFVDPAMIPDESGFILVHTAIEQRGWVVPGIIGRTKLMMHKRYHLLVATRLWELNYAMEKMYAELIKMPRWCDPAVYYREVRPQIQLFKDVLYEGCADIAFIKPFPIDFSKPVTLRGETGAQTPLIALIIAFLKIPARTTPLTQHLRDMRNYMLPEQRSFIELVERTPSVRRYAQRYRSAHPGLREAYNACIENLYQFLRCHYGYALEYVEKRGEGPTGTGGTPFKKYLMRHLREVEQGKI